MTATVVDPGDPALRARLPRTRRRCPAAAEPRQHSGGVPGSGARLAHARRAHSPSRACTTSPSTPTTCSSIRRALRALQVARRGPVPRHHGDGGHGSYRAGGGGGRLLRVPDRHGPAPDQHRDPGQVREAVGAADRTRGVHPAGDPGLAAGAPRPGADVVPRRRGRWRRWRRSSRSRGTWPRTAARRSRTSGAPTAATSTWRACCRRRGHAEVQPRPQGKTTRSADIVPAQADPLSTPARAPLPGPARRRDARGRARPRAAGSSSRIRASRSATRGCAGPGRAGRSRTSAARTAPRSTPSPRTGASCADGDMLSLGGLPAPVRDGSPPKRPPRSSRERLASLQTSEDMRRRLGRRARAGGPPALLPGAGARGHAHRARLRAS